MKKKPCTKTKSKTVTKGKKRKPAKARAKPVKSTSKRPSKKKKAASAPRSSVIKPLNGILLGYVEDYFAKIGVVAVTLKAPVAVGQRIQVLGHTTNLEQPVDSMQIDHLVVTQAGAKDGVGIKVIGRARRGDHVYLLK